MVQKDPYANAVQIISLKKYPRATIAKRLYQSYSTKVHITFSVNVDMSVVKKEREKLRKEMEEKFAVKLTYTGILLKLTAKALRKHLYLNSIVENDEAKVIDDINISVAIQSEKMGLITPVIRQVDKKSLGEIAVELNEITKKARTGKLTLDDLAGGTFTITNLGMLASVDEFTPIINPPQSAILGIGRIIDKPIVVNGRIESRSTCTLNLTVDHRVIDGYLAAQFLSTLKNLIEKPYRSVQPYLRCYNEGEITT